MKRMVYADNAATTQLDIDAFEAMKPFLLTEYGNASQPYSFARSAKKALKESREIIAKCIGALPEEIYFTSGGTESNNWVIKSSALNDSRKRPMVTSQIEHHALLHSCSAIEQWGYPVVYLPVNSYGEVSVDKLREVLSNDARLVSIMFSNNEIGTIQPIKELAEISHSSGALFHTDAVQAVGHVKIDVRTLGVDFLSASAHKFNGPKGTGFLYIRKGVDLLPYADGGKQEYGLRAGTENVAGIVGMAVALEKNCTVLDAQTEYIWELENRLLTQLDGRIEYIRNGGTNRIPGNISLSFRDIEGEALLHRLDLMHICVSTGSACDSVNTQISHVLNAINLDKSYARGTIRISLGKHNTVDEVDTIAHALIKIIGK